MFSIEKIKKRLGIQILFDFNDIIDAIDFGLDNNLKVIELNLNNITFTQQVASRKARKEIHGYLQKYKVSLLFHAIEGLSFFVPDKDAQKFVVKSLTKTMKYASEIGVKRITFHLGSDMNFGLIGEKKRTYEVFPEYFYHLIYDALYALRQNVPNNLYLCLENVGGFRYPFVFDLMPKVLGGRLGLTMDIGHINRFTGQEKEREFNFFKTHRRLIKNCHIHDNNGEWDQHNIIGEGNIDFQPYFELLADADTYYIFEVRPKESAIECVKRFNKMFLT